MEDCGSWGTKKRLRALRRRVIFTAQDHDQQMQRHHDDNRAEQNRRSCDSSFLENPFLCIETARRAFGELVQIDAARHDHR